MTPTPRLRTIAPETISKMTARSPTTRDDTSLDTRSEPAPPDGGSPDGGLDGGSDGGSPDGGLDGGLDAQTRILLGAEEDDSRLLRRALGVAAVFHIVLLLITFPDLSRPEKLREAGPRKVYVVQQVRFQPPAAAPQQEIPKKKAKRIPIPDPTPDDPEPIPVEELDLPEVEPSLIDVASFGIPDAPPSPGTGSADGPIYLGAGITPPVKLVFPQPRYTEEARQARIQGTVILQAVIDRQGNVGEVLIIKGLPLGLDESAIETVQEWKFKPALRGAEPVAVYLNLMINFSLQ